MTSIPEMVGAVWQQLSSPFRTKHESAAIDSLGKLQSFIAGRSAYVARQLLLEYIKARMGENYRRVFDDERLAALIDILQLELLAACLSDLTIYAVATVLGKRDGADRMAQTCYVAALHDIAGDAPARFSLQECIGEFVRRLSLIDWELAAREPADFIRNPNLLLRGTSILEELENVDSGALENAIELTWSAIRREFAERLDAGAIIADWSRRMPT